MLKCVPVGAAGTVVSTENVRTFSVFAARRWRAASSAGLQMAGCLSLGSLNVDVPGAVNASKPTEQRSLVALSLGSGVRYTRDGPRLQHCFGLGFFQKHKART